MQIPFNADEINTKQIVSTTLKKLNALSEETCAGLTATTKRRKKTERNHSIKTRLAKAKEQAKQPTAAGEKSRLKRYSSQVGLIKANR